ncbi:MAG: phage tail protein [Chlorobiaceae bacterium]|nr:phage tail protein [Chlorobiaceae bacterium]
MDEMLAIIKLFAGPFVPVGYMECNGQTLSIMSNQALFSLLGVNFGGDGVHNFQLPDLRPMDGQGNRRPWNANEARSIICVQGIYPSHD